MEIWRWERERESWVWNERKKCGILIEKEARERVVMVATNGTAEIDGGRRYQEEKM